MVHILGQSACYKHRKEREPVQMTDHIPITSRELPRRLRSGFSRSDYYAGNRAKEFLWLNGLSGCAQTAPGMLLSIFVWVSATVAFLP